jgi:hypothetical protein
LIRCSAASSIFATPSPTLLFSHPVFLRFSTLKQCPLMALLRRPQSPLLWRAFYPRRSLQTATVLFRTDAIFNYSPALKPTLLFYITARNESLPTLWASLNKDNFCGDCGEAYTKYAGLKVKLVCFLFQKLLLQLILWKTAIVNLNKIEIRLKLI